MKFEEALPLWKKGKMIRLSTWPLFKFLPMIEICDTFSFSSSCLFSDDWEVLEEPGKTFPEVFEAFKEGKKIRRKKWGYVVYSQRDQLDALNHFDILATDWEVIE